MKCSEENASLAILRHIQNDFICIDEGVGIDEWVDAVSDGPGLLKVERYTLKTLIGSLFLEGLIGVMLTQSAMDAIDDVVPEFQHILRKEANNLDNAQ